MEKLRIEEFENYKIRLLEILNEVEDETTQIPRERESELIEEYEEILKTIFKYDLSDISAAMWEGIFILDPDELEINFEGTKANLDFNILRGIDIPQRNYVVMNSQLPSFKGCRITNFPFGTMRYTPEMFDEEFVAENSERFLSEDVPEELREKFYKSFLSFKELEENQEIREKFLPEQLSEGEKTIYELIGREEFLKLDFSFLQETLYWSIEKLNGREELKKAEDIMEYLYTEARENLIRKGPGYNESLTNNTYLGNHSRMGEVFKERYPELYISEEAPKYVKDSFYSRDLNLFLYINNIEYFKDIDMRCAFKDKEYDVYQYFGEDMYELFEKYGKYIYPPGNGYYNEFVIPESAAKTIDDKKEVIFSSIGKRLEKNPIKELEGIKVLSERFSIEEIVGKNKYATIVSSVGIEKLETLGFSNVEIFDEGITDVNTIREMADSLPDISLIVPQNITFSDTFTIDDVKRIGIEDLSVLLKDYTQDISGAKELIDKGIPLEAISFGAQTEIVRDFIRKYGIDNIIKFEEETKMFSVKQIGDRNCQLELLANQEKNMSTEENTEIPDYEYFRNRVYEILIASRKKITPTGKKGFLTTRDFSDYSHMEGRFREEHSEMFVEGVPEEIRKAFYFGTITPILIQNNPELVDALKEKRIEEAFSQEIRFPALVSAKGDIVAFNKESFSEYVSKKYGRDKFLKLCVDYGGLICDKTNVFRNTNASYEEFVEEFEQNIYKQIKNGLAYSEKVPETFKEKHPELFLSENVSIEVRELFYNGNFSFDTIKKHPELVEELQEKDIAVGFEKLSHINWGPYNNRNVHLNRKYGEILEKLSKEDVFKLAQKYGNYLIGIKPVFLDNNYSNFEELDEVVKQNLREELLSGRLQYSEDAPEFLKEEYPEFFLAEDAPELLKLAYYSKYISKEEPYLNHASSNYGFTIDLLKEHPEFKKYLEGKKLDLVTEERVSNLAKKFSTQEILEMIEIDSEALVLLSRNANVISKFRRNIDERPKDRENILRFPGYTLYYSDDRREEFSFSEYKEIVKMSKFTVSENYRRDTAEQILTTMYDFLGYAETKEILRLPELDEERIEEIIRSHGQAFRELYEEKFKLKGNLRVLNTLFDKFVPQLPGKKGSLDVYKLLNQKIEEGYNGSIEDLLLTLMQENNLEFDADRIKSVSKSAIEVNTSEKLEIIEGKVSTFINEEIEETIANKKILKDILFNVYRKTLYENDRLDEIKIRELLEKEFSRTREDGGTFYSPHITDHLEDLLKVTKEINDSQEYGTKVNKSVVDILREEKESIGQGWIRKLLELRPELKKEELENLRQKLYRDSNTEKIETTRLVRLKDTSDIGMENAYVFLKELELPGIFTYEKGEQMFAGLSKPYSENFKKFFLQNQKDILRKPEYYTIFQRMHSEFERIIQDSHISTRFKAGLYTLLELKTELDRTTYPDVRDGEYELEFTARKAGLETEYWPRAQEVYAKMLEREIQSVPPVEVSGKKYRGRILRIDDPLHLVIGNITTCCQRFGKGQPGEPSMLHSALEKNGSVFIVEEIDEQGRVVGGPIAQSWTWRNGDRICFDNVEIPDTLESELKRKEAYDPILVIYMETAKKMIEIDKRMLKKMLDGGKITKEQYDQFIIKEVTIGTGCDDLLRNISPNLRSTLERSNTVKPIEENQGYETVTGEIKFPWIDSNVQLILASNDEAKEKGKHTSYSGEVLVEYTKIREVLRREGRDISSDLILRMKQMLERADKKSSSLIGRLTSNSIIEVYDDADDYLENEKEVALRQSSNDDWYILTREDEKSITILDSLLTSGVNTVENQIHMDSKLAKYEYLNEILSIMQIAKQTGKVVNLNQEREGEYLDFEVLIKNGTLILEDGNIKIGNEENVKRIRESLMKKIEIGKDSRIVGEEPETEEKTNKNDDERL